MYYATAYKYAALDDIQGLQIRQASLAKALKLKGTIILSSEGVNVSVCGERDAVLSYCRHIEQLPGLERIAWKCSEVSTQVFQRLKVQIRKEIVALKLAQEPLLSRCARHLPPEELKAKLDAGERLTLLDVRNIYEVEAGSFVGALHPKIEAFCEFPTAVEKLALDKHAPIVMFCTGGVRCEKASAYLADQGYTNLYQLEGGLLSYGERCGGAHFSGKCFVFDERVAVALETVPSSPREALSSHG